MPLKHCKHKTWSQLFSRAAKDGVRPPLLQPGDVDDELAAHIAMRAEELAAAGLAPEEARAAAERRFGNRAAIARRCRDIDDQRITQARRARMWTDLRQDVAYAFRLLRRAPGFSAAAIGTLALGLGATTTIFSLANWTLLRPLAGIKDSEALQQIWVGTRTERGFSPSRISYPNLADITPRLQTVVLAGTQGGGTLNVAAHSEPARSVAGAFVTANYFEVLRTPFALGRSFTQDEDRPGGPAHVAIVSEGLARSLFGTPAAALGQSLTINGLPFTVIGIPSDGFEGTHRVRPVAIWMPGSVYPAVNHMPTLRYDDRATGGFYELIGRPQQGYGVPQIEAELQGIATWLASEFPKENSKFTRTRFHMLGSLGIDPLARDQLTSSVLVMLGSSAVVLLIACANVASLLLMRGIGRTGEVAVRTALGAGRLRIIRQHLTEGAVLWLLGGAAALGVVWLALQVVSGAALLGLRGEVRPVPLDWRVAVFALLLSLTVGLVFAVLPGWRSARVDAAGTLKQGTSSSGPRTHRVGATLSAMQLALSLTLVIGALLLGSTMRSLARVDLGFDPQHVQVFMTRTASVGYSPAQNQHYLDEFVRRLRQVPGVEEVAVGANLPFGGSYGTRLRAVGAAAYINASATMVATPTLFRVLRIPLLNGRTFTADDLGGSGASPRHVVVLSAQLAKQVFGTADAVGRTIEYGTIDGKGKVYDVIGIVGDVRARALTEPMEPMVYEVAEPAILARSAMVATRTVRELELATDIRTIAADLNVALPVSNVTSLETRISDAHAEWITLSRLMNTLAVMAAALAAVGLYAVIAFGVAARQREFGIRLALGAAPHRLVRLVLQRTAAIVACGVILGFAGAILLTGVIESRLFGVTRFDPIAWLSAAVLLLAMALAASWVPARRATRVPLTQALRAQ